jgi:hypothetical protein
LNFVVMALRRQQSRRLLARHAEDDLVMASSITQLIHIEEEEEPHWGGSVPGRRTMPHNRFSGYRLLYADYFADESLSSMMMCSVNGLCSSIVYVVS